MSSFILDRCSEQHNTHLKHLRAKAVSRSDYEFRRFIEACALLLLASTSVGQAVPPARHHSAQVVYRESTFQPIDPAANLDSITFSPDGRRIAYAVRRGEQVAPVVDGVVGRPYDKIFYFLFSPDGKRIAYIAKRELSDLIVLDGKEQPEFVRVYSPMFSRDSRLFMYEGDQHRPNQDDLLLAVVIDNDGEHRYVKAAVSSFSVDNRRVAYVVQDGAGQAVIVDGVVQGSYEEVGEAPTQDRDFCWRYPRQPVFSPDGKHIAYMVRVGKEQFVIRDGVRGRPYRHIDWCSLRFGDDSKDFAYVVSCGRMQCAVVNEQQGIAYDEVTGFDSSFMLRMGSVARPVYRVRSGKKWAVANIAGTAKWDGILTIVISQDAKHLAYVVQDNGNVRMIHDGKESRPYQSVALEQFSADSAHLTYRAFRDKKMFMVCDGREGTQYDDIDTVSLQIDCTRLAYEAVDDQKRLIITRGVSAEGYGLTVSSHGDHLAYLIRRLDKVYVVHDEFREGPYEAVDPGSLQFSVQGESVVYVVSRGKEQMVSFNGATGKPYDEIESNPTLFVNPAVFLPKAKSVAYIARIGSNHVLVANNAESPKYDLILPFGKAVNEVHDGFEFAGYRDGVLFRTTLEVAEQSEIGSHSTVEKTR
jgi:hypothetical protein